MSNNKITEEFIYSEESSAKKRHVKGIKKEDNIFQNHRKKKSD